MAGAGVLGSEEGRASSDTTSKAQIARTASWPHPHPNRRCAMSFITEGCLASPVARLQALPISAADKTDALCNPTSQRDRDRSWMTLTASAATDDLLYPAAALDLQLHGAGIKDSAILSRSSLLHFSLELPSVKLDCNPPGGPMATQCPSSLIPVECALVRRYGRFAPACQGCYSPQDLVSTLSIFCAPLTTFTVSPPITRYETSQRCRHVGLRLYVAPSRVCSCQKQKVMPAFEEIGPDHQQRELRAFSTRSILAFIEVKIEKDFHQVSTTPAP